MYVHEYTCLQVRNGERKWYALKDKKLLGRSKGAIQLELDVVFSHVRGLCSAVCRWLSVVTAASVHQPRGLLVLCCLGLSPKCHLLY